MPELLEVYDLKGKLLGTEERQEFYRKSSEEFGKNGRVSRKLKTITLLLMNSQGRIYLQKRSNAKPQNPGLFDKTVGGHVSKGSNWNVTAIKECAEELGFPAAVLPEKEFQEAIKTVDLTVIGILRQVAREKISLSLRKTERGEFTQAYDDCFYLGYYDGYIKFKDGEATGIQTYSLKELEAEMQLRSLDFTEDLKSMVKKYRKLLVPLNSL